MKNLKGNKVNDITTVFAEDIATAFDEHFYDWQQFLNTKTGEIVTLSRDDVLDTDEDVALDFLGFAKD